MRRILWITLLLFCGSVHAQLLPIIFDQAITLPAETDIWDVMPHPDGYYVWIAAIEPQTGMIGIYWGRTDTGEQDFVDRPLGSRHQLFAYWAMNHEPACILVSRRYFNDDMDSTEIRRINLTTGSETVLWNYVAFYGPGPWYPLLLRDYHIAAYLPLPPPPAVSFTVFATIGFFHWEEYGNENYTTVRSIDLGMICRNLLQGPFPEFEYFQFPDGYGFGLWGDASITDSTIFAVGTGNLYDHTWYQGYPPSTYYGVEASLRRVESEIDTSVRSWSVESGTPADRVVCTADSASNNAILFTRINGVCGAVGGDRLSWTTSTDYSHWLAADVVPNNGHEEFLCYDPSRQVFDILDPLDGHSYGSSTICGIMNTGAKIISRYDSTFRRLALRSGNQLQLYRFGEYLAANENVILPPSSFSLSNFPNPFNSTTQIRFDLPRTGYVLLRVFDITGREVAMLKDEILSAGSHAVDFDASFLPSGVYIYRLTSTAQSQARKMVLLK
jgi:hypothetical protein